MPDPLPPARDRNHRAPAAPGAPPLPARLMKPRPYALAYLGRILPVISETFVVREIVALRRLGLSVKVFSLHPPETGVSHPEAPGLAREAEVLIQPRNPRFWLAHLIFALRFPRRYFHCLYAYVLTPGGPSGSRRRCLSYFMVAPFAAWRLRAAGIQHLHAHFANAPASVALMAAALAGISFSFTAHAYDIFIDRLLLPAKLSAAAFVACISRITAATSSPIIPKPGGRISRWSGTVSIPPDFAPTPTPRGPPLHHRRGAPGGNQGVSRPGGSLCPAAGPGPALPMSHHRGWPRSRPPRRS